MIDRWLGLLTAADCFDFSFSLPPLGSSNQPSIKRLKDAHQSRCVHFLTWLGWLHTSILYLLTVTAIRRHVKERTHEWEVNETESAFGGTRIQGIRLPRHSLAGSTELPFCHSHSSFPLSPTIPRFVTEGLKSWELGRERLSQFLFLTFMPGSPFSTFLFHQPGNERRIKRWDSRRPKGGTERLSSRYTVVAGEPVAVFIFWVHLLHAV